jgi:hypothetical protein
VFSWKETQDAAHALGLTLQSHEVQGQKDFAPAFAMIDEERPGALLVLQDAVTMQQRKESSTLRYRGGCRACFRRKDGHWLEV